MTLPELSKKMQDIDFCMLFTHDESGAMAGRPMSNNGEVEYDGNSFFFTFDTAKTVHDIERDPTVALSFAGSKGLLGKPGLFISIEGKAQLIRDKSEFSVHWTKGLDRWFEQGVDTPGIALIHYWEGEHSEEIAG
jgi:general stress protein 26